MESSTRNALILLLPSTGDIACCVNGELKLRLCVLSVNVFFRQLQREGRLLRLIHYEISRGALEGLTNRVNRCKRDLRSSPPYEPPDVSV